MPGLEPFVDDDLDFLPLIWAQAIWMRKIKSLTAEYLVEGKSFDLNGKVATKLYETILYKAERYVIPCEECDSDGFTYHPNPTEVEDTVTLCYSCKGDKMIYTNESEDFRFLFK